MGKKAEHWFFCAKRAFAHFGPRIEEPVKKNGVEKKGDRKGEKERHSVMESGNQVQITWIISNLK